MLLRTWSSTVRLALRYDTEAPGNFLDAHTPGDGDVGFFGWSGPFGDHGVNQLEVLPYDFTNEKFSERTYEDLLQERGTQRIYVAAFEGVKDQNPPVLTQVINVTPLTCYTVRLTWPLL